MTAHLSPPSRPIQQTILRRRTDSADEAVVAMNVGG